MSQGAAIVVDFAGAATRVEQQRPDVGRLLVGMPADQAVKLVPTLLPICREAQSIAAQRAVEAVRGEDESEQLAKEREHRLLREQALACAWRLLVDWPRLLQTPAQLSLLKRLRRSDDFSLASILKDLLTPLLGLPEERGLTESAPEVTATGSELLSQSKHDSDLPEQHETLTGNRLWTRARKFLAQRNHSASSGEGTRNNASLLNTGLPRGPAIVGPLAMARHEDITAIADDTSLPITTRMFLAMLHDSRAVSDALETGRCLPAQGDAQQSLGDGIAAGFACTSRGPLHHCVSLDAGERVRDWAILSPTDWHFAPDGLVPTLATHCGNEASLRRLVAAADPCAAWRVGDHDVDPRREAA